MRNEYPGKKFISIHAPLAGSDHVTPCVGRRNSNFNPRSPCGERLPVWSDVRLVRGDFNPRSPCGERRQYPCNTRAGRYFNPRSPCGERPRSCSTGSSGYYFNPRSPCGERPAPVSSMGERLTFQSTLPLRGATMRDNPIANPTDISIHAPLAGSDHVGRIRTDHIFHFNPRSPCGERPISQRGQELVEISIHAPLAGSDAICATALPDVMYFNPRSPCGERHLRRAPAFHPG